VELVLYPVRVQGYGASEEIAEAIRAFNAEHPVDVLIVGRGGGAMEDLWAFNEEPVARAIYDSGIPIISAVGHEIDFTICDFVADLRAPTPSAAAELAVPDQRELIESLADFCYTSKQLMVEKISSDREKIRSMINSYAFNKPVDLLREHGQRLERIRDSMSRTLAHRFTVTQQMIQSLQQQILSLSPQSILRRGYAVITRRGETIMRASTLEEGDKVGIRFQDGERGAIVDK
jgi:exodeoxyribonuclease VII large subunit